MIWRNVIAAIHLVAPMLGAWDGTELTNRAIVVSSSLDKLDKDQYRLGYQVVLPGGLSPQEAPKPEERSTFFVVDGVGDTLLSAAQSAQTRLSRKYFLGHRKNIFLGEPLAQQGLSNVVDELTRNPYTRLRTDVFVVEGSEAEPMLHVSSPLEHLPGMAALKSRQNVGAVPGRSFLEFLVAAANKTSCPTLPAIRVTRDSKTNSEDIVQFAGRAIFDKKLKLRGYINFYESVYRLWILGTLTTHVFTSTVPGHPGKISFVSTRFSSRLRPVMVNGHIKMYIDLYTTGKVNESNVKLTFDNSRNLKLVENALDQTYTKHISKLINKFQNSFHLDALGYDKAVQEKYPAQWKTMKNQWMDIFPTIQSVVQTISQF